MNDTYGYVEHLRELSDELDLLMTASGMRTVYTEILSSDWEQDTIKIPEHMILEWEAFLRHLKENTRLN